MGTNIFAWTFLQQNQYQQTRQCQEWKVHQHYTYRQCMDVLQNIQTNKSLVAGISFNLTLVAQWGKDWFVKFNTPKSQTRNIPPWQSRPWTFAYYNGRVFYQRGSLNAYWETSWDRFLLKISLKDSVIIFCSSQTNSL